jgi:hypothetical protein
MFQYVAHANALVTIHKQSLKRIALEGRGRLTASHGTSNAIRRDHEDKRVASWQNKETYGGRYSTTGSRLQELS